MFLHNSPQNKEVNSIGFFSILVQFRKWLYLIVLIIIVWMIYNAFSKTEATSTIEYNSNLIEKQIRNVGKLVVTEGTFAEILTYKDQKKYLMDLVSIEKRALIIVNAEVTISYDLNQIEYSIEEKNKIVRIHKIPQEEIKIYPKIEYYDIDQNTLNPFTGKDYNKVATIVQDNLSKKINQSSLKKNAENRLISELSKILILTNSMGWTLTYKGQNIEDDLQLTNTIKG